MSQDAATAAMEVEREVMEDSSELRVNIYVSPEPHMLEHLYVTGYSLIGQGDDPNYWLKSFGEQAVAAFEASMMWLKVWGPDREWELFFFLLRDSDKQRKPSIRSMGTTPYASVEQYYAFV